MGRSKGDLSFIEFGSRGESCFGFPVRLVWVAGQWGLDLQEQFLHNHGGGRTALGQDDQVYDEIQQVHYLVLHQTLLEYDKAP